MFGCDSRVNMMSDLVKQNVSVHRFTLEWNQGIPARYAEFIDE